MQRGKIIQYNQNEGNGILTSEGGQYPFAITQWRGESAPELNRIVDVDMADGAVASVTPVAESVLLSEKANELKNKLGSALSSGVNTVRSNLDSSGTEAPAAAGTPPSTGATAAGSAAGSASGAAMAGPPLPAQQWIDFLGKGLIGGYIVFILATAFFSFVKFEVLGNSQGLTLLDFTGIVGSGSRPLLYLAFVSILVPIFWRDRRAWLATLLPLLSVIVGMWSLTSRADELDRMSNYGGGMMGGMMNAAGADVSGGLGAYLTVPAALFIAFLGWKRYKQG